MRMNKRIRKINSVHYGGTAIGIGFILVVIGVLLHFIASIPAVIWVGLMIAGVTVLIGITIWLVIESLQDRYWNRYFIDSMNQKLPLDNGGYECQKCGNRMVRAADTQCGICGCLFDGVREGSQ